ncbi:hypothetical protein [Microbacterium sp. ZXX196]|uniref:hypothetical protein n=1 Tax=Microbacterium sp. ZXX196 TaxID=2609291 RepID=UPI0012B80FF9|nr:hypothetical protein [Microbacterium sp. ZXX196]MTE24848.1 hypothetical protein [Microbacterium sp. ZXX196]
MADQMTPAEMRATAERLRHEARVQEKVLGAMDAARQVPAMRSGANALDALAAVTEWALDDDRPVIDHESYAIAQGDALYVIREVRDES